MEHYRLYQRWYNMIYRCHNPKSTKYKYYGEKGITVCEEWKNSFSAFKEWALSSGYADNLQLDRIDNEKGYSPDNCRWITREENLKKEVQDRINREYEKRKGKEK